MRILLFTCSVHNFKPFFHPRPNFLKTFKGLQTQHKRLTVVYLSLSSTPSVNKASPVSSHQHPAVFHHSEIEFPQNITTRKWEPQASSTTIRNTVTQVPPPNAHKPTIPTLHPHRFLHQVTDITIFHDFEASSFSLFARKQIAVARFKRVFDFFRARFSGVKLITHL